MISNKYFQSILKLVILFFICKCYFCYGVSESIKNKKEIVYSTQPIVIIDEPESSVRDPEIILITDDSDHSGDDLEPIIITDNTDNDLQPIIITDDTSDTDDKGCIDHSGDHLRESVIANIFHETISDVFFLDHEHSCDTVSHLDLCKVTKEELINIFGDRLPKDKVLWGFGKPIYDMIEQTRDCDCKDVFNFTRLKDMIIFYIGELEGHHQKAVGLQSKYPFNSHARILYSDSILTIINDLFVSTLQFFAYEIGIEKYELVAKVNKENEIVVDFSMANTEEQIELLNSFMDFYKSNIEMHKSLDIKTYETIPFYYIKYYAWFKEQVIKFILKKLEGEDRRKAALSYISVVGIYGDFMRNRKQGSWNNRINADLIESIKSMGNHRLSNKK